MAFPFGNTGNGRKAAAQPTATLARTGGGDGGNPNAVVKDRPNAAGATPASVPAQDASAVSAIAPTSEAPVNAPVETDDAADGVETQKALDSNCGLQKKFAELQRELDACRREKEDLRREKEDLEKQALYRKDADRELTELVKPDCQKERLERIIDEIAKWRTDADRKNQFANECKGLVLQCEKKDRELHSQKEQLAVERNNCDELRKKASELEQKNGKLQSDNEALKAREEQIELFLKASVPSSLLADEAFGELPGELWEKASGENPSDAAVRLLAALAELSVMERMRKGGGADDGWADVKKKLAEVGGAAANYFRVEEGGGEKSVVDRLVEFSKVFSDSGVQFVIPVLGSGFDIEQVKHLDGGTDVRKVVNWGVRNFDGSVYCKAVVK